MQYLAINKDEIKVGEWVETCQLLPGIVTEVNGDDVMVFIPGKHTIVDKCGGCHSIKCCGVHKIDGDYARKLFAIGEDKLNELWYENDGKLPWDEFINEYWKKI